VGLGPIQRFSYESDFESAVRGAIAIMLITCFNISGSSLAEIMVKSIIRKVGPQIVQEKFGTEDM